MGRVIAASRYIAIIGVVFGLVAALTAFGWGSYKTIAVVVHLAHGEVESMAVALVAVMDATFGLAGWAGSVCGTGAWMTPMGAKLVAQPVMVSLPPLSVPELRTSDLGVFSLTNVTVAPLTWLTTAACPPARGDARRPLRGSA